MLAWAFGALLVALLLQWIWRLLLADLPLLVLMGAGYLGFRWVGSRFRI
jgi:hypothetical protein